jgi:hypothetical protein
MEMAPDASDDRESDIPAGTARQGAEAAPWWPTKSCDILHWGWKHVYSLRGHYSISFGYTIEPGRGYKYKVYPPNVRMARLTKSSRTVVSQSLRDCRDRKPLSLPVK